MATENHDQQGSQPITNPPGTLDPNAPDMPDSQVLLDPVALKQGHEPDTVNVRAVMYVPIALVLTFALAYAIVTVTVGYLRAPTKDDSLAGKRNDIPINERLNRITSDEKQKAEVPQPRLEGLERFQQDTTVAPFDPSYMRSRVPTEFGNAPHYHPEDMRPSSKHSKDLGLQDFAWVNKSKGIIRMPITDAMKWILTAKNPSNPNKNWLIIDAKALDPKDLAPKSTASNPLGNTVPRVKPPGTSVQGAHP